MWGTGYLFVVLKMGERKRSVAEACGCAWSYDDHLGAGWRFRNCKKTKSVFSLWCCVCVCADARVIYAYVCAHVCVHV